MKVLVCGGRDYSDYEALAAKMDDLDYDRLFTHLIHGGATGADTLAEHWAMARGVQPVRCQALWERHGKSAGAIRNNNMLALGPDLVVAFPGGKGTANMVKIAKEAGVEVIEVAS